MRECGTLQRKPLPESAAGSGLENAELTISRPSVWFLSIRGCRCLKLSLCNYCCKADKVLKTLLQCTEGKHTMNVAGGSFPGVNSSLRTQIAMRRHDFPAQTHSNSTLSMKLVTSCPSRLSGEVLWPTPSREGHPNENRWLCISRNNLTIFVHHGVCVCVLED